MSQICLKRLLVKKFMRYPYLGAPAPQRGIEVLGPYKSWSSYILETAWRVSMILFATYFLHQDRSIDTSYNNLGPP